MKKITILLLSFCTLNIISCNGQSVKSDSCKNTLRIVKTNLNKFYRSADSSLLKQANRDIDFSLECPDIRSQSIDLKVSLLYLLKDYQKGFQFIKALNHNDFKLSYKKDMYANYFIALDYEAKKDKINSRAFFKKAIKVVELYNKVNTNTINEAAYYDEILLKSKIINSQELNKYLNSLKKTYPLKIDFFNGLKDTFLGAKINLSPI